MQQEASLVEVVELVIVGFEHELTDHLDLCEDIALWLSA
jgi:hypothetical protein